MFDHLLSLERGLILKHSIKEFDIVALVHDLPEYHLKQGQVGTVVDVLTNGDAFEVEFCDRDGRMLASLGLRSDQLMVLHHESLKETG